MNEEKKELEPFGNEILDATTKIQLVAQLDALEEAGIHVDSLMKRLQDPEGVLNEDLKHIHEGDIHHDQEGITVFDAFEEAVIDAPLRPNTEKLIPEKTYGAETRQLTRRRTRNTGRTILNRGRH